MVYIENYVSAEERLLHLRISGKRLLVTYEKLRDLYTRVLIANINPNYHFNYHQLELTPNRTVVMELRPTGRSHIYLSVMHNGLTMAQSRHSSLSICVYRVEEEILRLVTEKSSKSNSDGLWLELILKKGLYKLFISS